MENEITLGLFVNILAAVIIGLFTNVAPKARDYRGLLWVSILILLIANSIFFFTTSSIAPFLVLVVIVLLVLNIKFKGPGAYLNKRKKFLVEFPGQWKEITFIGSVIRYLFALFIGPKDYPKPRLYSPDNPELHGPEGEEIVFSIGPTHPSVAFTPTADEEIYKMRIIAKKHGHSLKVLPPIVIGGIEHATCYTSIPFGHDQMHNLVVKNYLVVFNNLEYFISAKLKVTHPLDEEKIIGRESVYDSIVKSFHPLSI